MQTYIVIGLIIAAAAYVAYNLLRRLGFLGAAAGCGCGCDGCPSLPSRGKQGGPELKARPMSEQSGPCCGCAAADACVQQNACLGNAEIKPRR